MSYGRRDRAGEWSDSPKRAEAGIESAQLLQARARLKNSAGVLRRTLWAYADSEKNYAVAQHLGEENGGFIRQP